MPRPPEPCRPLSLINMSKALHAEDVEMLLRAVALAEAWVGQTAPNPAVGAVCVRDGRILGEGAHHGAGLPHAEVNALAACQENPSGATLYVTLEPCSTTGRTPPCCDLIRAKGLCRVVIGCLDPNPRHAGRAIEQLQSAGIEVLLADGDVAQRCQELITPFAKAITRGLPYVRLKLALTLDGYLADATGTSQWVTGPEARAWVHQQRARVDAVMVGAGTVIADCPGLQPRLAHPVPPKRRIFVDRVRPIPQASINEHTWIATRDLAYDGHDLEALLRALCAKGINDILCEGGGKLAAALLEANLVDALDLIYAPKILGDPEAVRALPIAPRLLHVARTFKPIACQMLGTDCLFRLAPNEG